MVKSFIICVLTFILASSLALAQDEYTLNSTFSTIENCNYRTDGIFAVWWDKNYDYSSNADELLNTLIDCQNDCLNTYHMMNPPNPIAGFYYNVYIHNGHDLFPDGWAMGQGTDTNGYPFLTIPIGYANTNNPGAQHEGFHIFQYNANSPGFAYSGDSQWYVEATANWYAALKHPGSKEEYITASCITYNPQVPMWYTFNNREPQDQGSWVRYCHQYGMNIFINYLTDVRDISPEIIVGGFFAETQDLPQEYLYKNIGPENFCDLYADYTAHNVGGFEHFPPGTEARAYLELKNYGDLNDTHPIVDTFNNEGTNGEWIEPNGDFVTRAWAYNVYKIENSEKAEYTFYLKGNSLGDNGDPATFKGRIVVKNGSAVKYYPLDMADLTNGSYTYTADAEDEEIFLVIISTPNSFRGNHKFRYEVKIDYNNLSGIGDIPNRNLLKKNYPNPFDYETHIPYELTSNSEVRFTITDQNGRTVMNINEGLKNVGKHNLTFSSGNLQSGIYYYTITSGDYKKTRSMVIR